MLHKFASLSDSPTWNLPWLDSDSPGHDSGAVFGVLWKRIKRKETERRGGSLEEEEGGGGGERGGGFDSIFSVTGLALPRRCFRSVAEKNKKKREREERKKRGGRRRRKKRRV